MGAEHNIKRNSNGVAQVVRRRRTGWTKAQIDTFFTVLSETANVKMARIEAGMSHAGVYRKRIADGAFRAAWDHALAEGYMKLELLLLQQAFDGLEPIVVDTPRPRPAIKVSERGVLSLLTMHRKYKQVMEQRRADSAEGAEDDAASEERVRTELLATLSEIEARLKASDGDAQ